jgi:hypothetical protein
MAGRIWSWQSGRFSTKYPREAQLCLRFMDKEAQVSA